jgi:hypothetical protein
MAAIVNDRDVLLQAPGQRYTAPSSAAILISASAPAFAVDTAGTPTPASIKFTAVRIGLTGSPTFTASDGAVLTVSGDEATLTYANMPNGSTTVTVSVTEGGTLYSRAVTISKMFESGTTFTWLKYADDATGTGLSDSPVGKTYIGFATNKTTATESTNPADYTWSLIKGTDGQPAADKFIWIKYADYADGTGMYDVPHDDTVYIGIAVNKTTSAESTVKTDYVWSRFKGAQGVAGTGARGPGWFYAVGSAWNDTTAHAATPGDTQVDDTVTISDGNVSYTKRWNGSAWFVPGAFMDGSLFVEKSITAAKINANGLELRAPDGTLILGAGAALNQDYAAPGTKNSEVTPLIPVDLVLQPFNVTVTGNRAVKTGGSTAWDAQVASRDGFVGGAFASATVDALCTVMFGLNTDPHTDASFGSIDFAIYAYVDGTLFAYANGNNLTPNSNIGTYAAGDSLQVICDGSTVRYCKKGVVLHTLTLSAPVAGPLYLDSSFSSPGAALSNIRFGPMSDNSAGVAANAAIPGINSAIDDKLSKTSASSLAATVTVATGGSILAGNTTNGTYMSPSGFYGVQGGVVKFSVPISGDPTFAGQLTAAYGTFGAVSIASGGSFSSGQSAYDTGSGWWMGYVGGVPKLSIGVAGGAAMLWDGSTLTMRGAAVQNPTITNPTLDSFTIASISPINVSLTNGATRTLATRTISLSGGKTPYQSYSFVDVSGEGMILLVDANTQTCTFKAGGYDETKTAQIVATGIDANGRSVSTSFTITATFS